MGIEWLYRKNCFPELLTFDNHRVSAMERTKSHGPHNNERKQAMTEVKIDIEHVPVANDPRQWSPLKKVSLSSFSSQDKWNVYRTDNSAGVNFVCVNDRRNSQRHSKSFVLSMTRLPSYWPHFRVLQPLCRQWSKIFLQPATSSVWVSHYLLSYKVSHPLRGVP